MAFVCVTLGARSERCFSEPGVPLNGTTDEVVVIVLGVGCSSKDCEPLKTGTVGDLPDSSTRFAWARWAEVVQPPFLFHAGILLHVSEAELLP